MTHRTMTGLALLALLGQVACIPSYTIEDGEVQGGAGGAIDEKGGAPPIGEQGGAGGGEDVGQGGGEPIEPGFCPDYCGKATPFGGVHDALTDQDGNVVLVGLGGGRGFVQTHAADGSAGREVSPWEHSGCSESNDSSVKAVATIDGDLLLGGWDRGNAQSCAKRGVIERRGPMDWTQSCTAVKDVTVQAVVAGGDGRVWAAMRGEGVVQCEEILDQDVARRGLVAELTPEGDVVELTAIESCDVAPCDVTTQAMFPTNDGAVLVGELEVDGEMRGFVTETSTLEEAFVFPPGSKVFDVVVHDGRTFLAGRMSQDHTDDPTIPAACQSGNGKNDSFVAELAHDQSGYLLPWCTRFGGLLGDTARGIDVWNGELVVAGDYQLGSDHKDGFVAGVTLNGSLRRYETVGSRRKLNVYAMTLTAAGEPIVAGFIPAGETGPDPICDDEVTGEDKLPFATLMGGCQ